MIIIKFQGGLGNQMFQYAFLRTLEQLYPKVEVKADLTAYRLNQYHYGLEINQIFNVQFDKIATRKEIMRLSSYIPAWKKHRIIFKIKEKIISRFRRKTLKDSYLRQEDSLVFYDEFFRLNSVKDYYIEGFWCNEKYFELIKNTILKDFQFKKEVYHEKYEIVKRMSDVESVSVHIRRGDYVNSVFDTVGLDYYKESIKFIKEKIKQPIFYFFSDDIEYVEENFGFIENKVIIDDNKKEKSYMDMFLMSKCKHNIIANSTFSYWGAYLNNNLNKIVISPKCFTRKQEYPLACDSWIKI